MSITKVSSHSDVLEEISKKLNTKDKESIADIVDNTKLDLHRELKEDKFLYIEDKEGIKKISKILGKLG